MAAGLTGISSLAPHNDREARNKNFAGQVPVLDYLFGTLHLPRGRKPTKYGLDQPIPQTYAAQLLYPFRRASASIVTLTRQIPI